MKKKKRNKNVYGTIIKLLMCICFIGLTWMVVKNVYGTEQEICEETYIMEFGLDYNDWKTIDEEVVDYYVEEKIISSYYWNKLCRDLLKVELNETLSKSDDLWFDSHSWFDFQGSKLECIYYIHWGEEWDFKERVVEKGVEYFNQEEILLAQEKRPLKYNKSLISVEYDGEFKETILENNNLDYIVILNLKLNESICI